MSVADAGPSWSEIAGWYDGLIEGGSGAHETAVECLLRLLPELEGSRVIDVACGQGLASRTLADAGAGEVVGVDSSEAMLERARQRTQNDRISYVHDDAQTLASVEDASFDGAVCQLGLMDIPDLDATIAAVHRVLEPNGWFVFVIGHPCVLVPDAVVDQGQGADTRPGVRITGYFDERFWRSANPNGVRRAGNHHRTLGTYLNTLLGHGFQVERVEEPPASTRLAQQSPLYREVPIFFAARVRKTARPGTSGRTGTS